MAWTQTDIDGLKRAIAAGVLTVEMDGRRVTYQSLADMLRSLERLEASVAGAPRTAKSLRIVAGYDPGLG